MAFSVELWGSHEDPLMARLEAEARPSREGATVSREGMRVVLA